MDPALLANLPAQLIPLAIFAYVFNLSYIKWMAERREIIEALAADREEIIASLAADRRELVVTFAAERGQWQASQAATIDRQFALQEKVATALESWRNESHAFRNKVQELMARYELVGTPKPTKRGDSKGTTDEQ